MKNMQFLTDESLKTLMDTSSDFAAQYVIIDIRNPDEYAREHIEGSVNIPLDKLNAQSFLPYANKTVIFHCQTGNRTTQACEQLASLHCQQAYCLAKGISQWKQLGLPTIVNDNMPLPLMRQVQIVVGIMILTSIILGYMVSPYFNLIALFAGVGLFIAGLTGFCGLAKVLMFLPHNRPQTMKE